MLSFWHRAAERQRQDAKRTRPSEPAALAMAAVGNRYKEKWKREGMRRCKRDATHGGYCYQHAKKLTGIYEPDKNPPGTPHMQCQERIKN